MFFFPEEVRSKLFTKFITSKKTRYYNRNFYLGVKVSVTSGESPTTSSSRIVSFIHVDWALGGRRVQESTFNELQLKNSWVCNIPSYLTVGKRPSKVDTNTIVHAGTLCPIGYLMDFVWSNHEYLKIHYYADFVMEDAEELFELEPIYNKHGNLLGIVAEVYKRRYIELMRYCDESLLYPGMFFYSKSFTHSNSVFNSPKLNNLKIISTEVVGRSARCIKKARNRVNLRYHIRKPYITPDPGIYIREVYFELDSYEFWRTPRLDLYRPIILNKFGREKMWVVKSWPDVILNPF